MIAPWVNWGIKKRKLRLQARKSLIEGAREYIISKQFGGEQFSKKTWYAQLKPEMNSEIISSIEDFSMNKSEGNAASMREELRKTLLLELVRIESNWELI